MSEGSTTSAEPQWTETRYRRNGTTYEVPVREPRFPVRTDPAHWSEPTRPDYAPTSKYAHLAGVVGEGERDRRLRSGRRA